MLRDRPRDGTHPYVLWNWSLLQPICETTTPHSTRVASSKRLRFRRVEYPGPPLLAYKSVPVFLLHSAYADASKYLAEAVIGCASKPFKGIEYDAFHYVRSRYMIRLLASGSHRLSQ